MADLAGRTCIVTGATSGIGEETALGLARLGADLHVVGRSPERGRALLERIRAETGAGAHLHRADLASLAEVRRLAEALLAACPRIHVLVNNAGLVNLERRVTVDGFEETFAVNHLAHFALTLALLDRIVASAPARIVNVASDAHRFGPLRIDDLMSERDYGAMRAYARSKSANLLFTRELARRLEGTGVTVNAVHPGAVATRLGKQNGRLARVLTAALAPFFRSPARGAETSLHAATAPELGGVSGAYFASCRRKEPHPSARDDALARELWEASAALVASAGADA